MDCCGPPDRLCWPDGGGGLAVGCVRPSGSSIIIVGGLAYGPHQSIPPTQRTPPYPHQRPPKTKCDDRNPVVQLYRTISKEMPRVLTIYDADLSPQEVRSASVGWVS